MYDQENTGYLSPFELRQALTSAGYHLNNHILNILAHRYSGRDARISFDDFMMCAVRLKTMIGKFEIYYVIQSISFLVLGKISLEKYFI